MARKRNWTMMLMPIFIIVAIVAVYLATSMLPAEIFGTEWATISVELWVYLPWLIIFALGLFTFAMILQRRMGARRETQTVFTIFNCAVLGITTDMIISTMNTRGHIIDEFITGTISITDLLWIVFLLWILIGVIIATLD